MSSASSENGLGALQSVEEGGKERGTTGPPHRGGASAALADLTACFHPPVASALRLLLQLSRAGMRVRAVLRPATCYAVTAIIQVLLHSFGTPRTAPCFLFDPLPHRCHGHAAGRALPADLPA